MHRQTAAKSAPLAMILAIGVLGSRAAAAPPPINNLTGVRQLSAEDLARIQEYARFYAQGLGGSDLEAIDEARQRLWQPLRALGITVDFRNAYSQALVPLLGPIIEAAGSPLGATNALQVAADLGTEGALDLLQAHVHERDEPDVGIRLWAARGFRNLLARQDAHLLIQDRKWPPAIRALGSAAEHEQDWRVLQWQFDSLASIDHEIAREEEQRVFARILERMEALDAASPLIYAPGQSTDVTISPRGPLASLSSRLLQGADQRLAINLAANLLKLLRVAEKHWLTLDEHRLLRDAYRRTIRIAEQQLKSIDVVLADRIATPPTALEQSFAQRDLEAYRRDVQKMADHLNQPPYRSP